MNSCALGYYSGCCSYNKVFDLELVAYFFPNLQCFTYIVTRIIYNMRSQYHYHNNQNSLANK